MTISGLSFNVGGKHTWASQYVGVQTRTSSVVIASDNLYLYENFVTHKPISQTLDAVSNLRAQDRMRSLASDPRLLIPGHDPAVFDRFPHVSERIVRIE
jgi:glyoxylase-like metal-dependent hydrolase (beta-lactamase superfamily II)